METWITTFYRLVTQKGVRVREERRKWAHKTNKSRNAAHLVRWTSSRRTTTTQHVGWNFNHFARTFGENDFWRCRWFFYDWFDVVCLSHSRNGVNGLASSRLYWQSTTVLSDQLTNFMSRKSDGRGLNRKFIQIRRFNRQKSTFRGFFIIWYFIDFFLLF